MAKHIQGNYKNLKPDTIAELRTLTASTNGVIAKVKGYTTAGDGGGGPDRYWSEGQPVGTYTDNGSSIIVPTGGDGSAAWLWGDIDQVDAAWFGIGSSQNATTNTAAINTALSISSNVIVSLVGTYLINDTLLPSEDGDLDIKAGVVLKLDTDTPVNTPIISINSASNVRIHGKGTLNGNRTNQSFLGHIGVEVISSTDIVIEELTIVDTTDKPVHIRSGSDMKVSKITCSTIQQGETGLRCDDLCDRITFEDNTVTDCGTDGYSQFGDGILVGGSECKVLNNYVSGCNRIGIVLEETGTDNIVSENICIDNGGNAINPPAGIWAEQGGGAIITGNIIDQTNVSVTNHCISIVQRDVICNNNTVRGGSNTSFGIRAVGDNIVVDGNNVKTCVSGIVGESTPTQKYLVVSDNVVKDCTHGIRAFSNQQFLSIIDNKVSDFPESSVTGIELSTGSITFLDSVIAKNIIEGPTTIGGFVRDGMQLKNLTRCVIDGNIVRSAEDTGILLNGSNVENIIVNNISSDCANNYITSGSNIARNNFGGVDNYIATLASGEATPSVLNYEYWATAGTTTITDFDDGSLGQHLYIRATGSITIQHNGSIIDLNGSVDFNMASSNCLHLCMLSPGIWSEFGRSIN